MEAGCPAQALPLVGARSAPAGRSPPVLRWHWGQHDPVHLEPKQKAGRAGKAALNNAKSRLPHYFCLQQSFPSSPVAGSNSSSFSMPL